MKVQLVKSSSSLNWYNGMSFPIEFNVGDENMGYYRIRDGQHKGDFLRSEDCINDEDIVEESKAGLKYDKGKTRFDLYPLDAYEGCAKVLTFGAEKYTPNGWRTVSDPLNRYYAALIRHLNAQKNYTDEGGTGLATDEESGLPHLDHAQCCLIFLRELTKTK